MAKKEPLTILINDLLLNTHLHILYCENFHKKSLSSGQLVGQYIVLEGIVFFFVMFHRLMINR